MRVEQSCEFQDFYQVVFLFVVQSKFQSILAVNKEERDRGLGEVLLQLYYVTNTDIKRSVDNVMLGTALCQVFKSQLKSRLLLNCGSNRSEATEVIELGTDI